MSPRCTHSPSGAAAEQAERVAVAVPSLLTARLLLRAPRMTDLEAWTRLMVPDAEGHLGGPHTEEEAWEAFCIYVAGWLLHGHGAWTIEQRSDGTVLGFVQLGLEWDDLEPELGWMLLPEHRGHGFAVEAAAAARDHASAVLGPGHFVSYVTPDNTGSNAVAVRLGASRDTAAEIELGGEANVWRHRGHA